MPETPTRDAKLVQLLNEAYTKEKQLETALQAHLQMTTNDEYAKRLKDHLKETKSHATQVSRRIKQLGGSPETVSLPGPESLVKAAESVSEVVGKAKAAAQGPLHAVRGSGEQEKMLRNARSEYQEEAHEIATYTVIDSARQGGRRQADGKAGPGHPPPGEAHGAVPSQAAAPACSGRRPRRDPGVGNRGPGRPQDGGGLEAQRTRAVARQRPDGCFSRPRRWRARPGRAPAPSGRRRSRPRRASRACRGPSSSPRPPADP